MITVHKTDDGRVTGYEYLPCSAITPKVGMAMVITNGMLAKAGVTDMPKYICVTERNEACAAGDLVGVIRVLPDIVFETETPDGFTAKVGDCVKLSADGMTIGTATGGACEIVYTDSEVTRFRVVKPAAA